MTVFVKIVLQGLKNHLGKQTGVIPASIKETEVKRSENIFFVSTYISMIGVRKAVWIKCYLPCLEVDGALLLYVLKAGR